MGIFKNFSKNLETVKPITEKGVRYKRIKTFKNKDKAESFLEQISQKCNSKRFKPFIEETRIGPGMGYIYRICVPKHMEVKL